MKEIPIVKGTIFISKSSGGCASWRRDRRLRRQTSMRIAMMQRMTPPTAASTMMGVWNFESLDAVVEGLGVNDELVCESAPNIAVVNAPIRVEVITGSSTN